MTTPTGPLLAALTALRPTLTTTPGRVARLAPGQIRAHDHVATIEVADPDALAALPACHVDGIALLGALRAAPGPRVALTVTPDSLVAHSGTWTVTLRRGTAGIPPWPAPPTGARTHDLTATQWTQIRRLARLARLAATPGAVLPVLEHVQLRVGVGRLDATSTDRIYAGRVTLGPADGSWHGLLPASLAHAWHRATRRPATALTIDTTAGDLDVGRARAWLTGPGRAGAHVTMTHLVDTTVKYPELDALFNQPGVYSFTTDRAALATTARDLAALAPDTPVDLRVTDGTLTLALHADTITATVTLPATGTHPDATYNPARLAAVLNQLTGPTVTATTAGPHKAVTFTGTRPDAAFLLMPIRRDSTHTPQEAPR